MKRKLLSMILVVAMLASMLVIVPVSGATETVATVGIGDAPVAAGIGETVEIDIVLQSDKPLWDYAFSYAYDADKLTLVEIVDKLGNGLLAESAKGDTYKEITLSSPYSVFTWAQTNNTARDISAGVVIATMVFTVNEGASGEAKVELLNLQRKDGYNLNYIQVGASESKVKYGGNEIAIDNAETSILILPEDCASNFIIPGENEWDFEKGGLFGVLSEELLSASGVLVIPAEIGGVAVTFIDEKALSGGNWSSIIVPASVERMAGFAIHACENLKSVYILGADTELDAVAIGFSGTRTSRAVWIMNDDGTAPLTKIVAPAGSAAETYANTAEKDNENKEFTHPFAALGGKVTVNGISYYAPAVTKAPGMMETADGKLVVAWTDGVNTYSAGAPMTLTGDVTLEAAKTIAKPQTTTELDFKLAPFYAEDGETRLERSDLSMRFKATFSVADYATLADLAGEEGSVQLGMLITPAKYVALAGSFTKEALGALKGTNGVALGANAYVNVAIESYMSKTATDYVFGARLANFSADTLAKNPDFAAVMYATVTTADGTVFTVYGDFNLAANRNVKAVAQTIHDDPARDLTTTQKGWLSDLIGSFN